MAFLSLPALPALAAQPETDAAALQKLIERVERLEARNAQLEREVRALRGTPAAMTENPATDGAAENETGIAARLKMVEEDVVAMKNASTSPAEKRDGATLGAALTTVWQKANGLPHGTHANNKLNYRADLSIEAPLESAGAVEHKLFAHLRVGQGQGLNETLGYLGHHNIPNATAFRVSGAEPDDAVVLLGQAWYQAAIPFGKASRRKLELTFGKVDVFGFFDRNEAADDETAQFLNTVFIHNPLLDAGGELGVDANGFQPGFIASYLDGHDGPEPWRLSFGVFGAGDAGANYEDTTDSPLVIAQAEKKFSLFGGHSGNYRLYVWARRNVPDFISGASKHHTGFGISVDQRVGEGMKLFGRYGQILRGNLHFNRALAIGAEASGLYWGRASDSVGIAGSWLWTSRSYKRAGGKVYLNHESFKAGDPDFRFRPSSSERVAEIYYRYALTPQFSLTPDVQWIWRGGANPHAGTVSVFGLRANIAY
ncbi:MAG: carbohydrate porin [Azoarcus sp.]|nr:carbohydrate porin [Azoarcus sp.]